MNTTHRYHISDAAALLVERISRLGFPFKLYQTGERLLAEIVGEPSVIPPQFILLAEASSESVAECLGDDLLEQGKTSAFLHGTKLPFALHVNSTETLAQYLAEEESLPAIASLVMFRNVENNYLHDPCGALPGLKNRRLEAFPGNQDDIDPLQAARLSVRYNLVPDISVFKRIDADTPVDDRQFFETMNSIFVSGKKISPAIRFLEQAGVLKQYPEIADMRTCPQNPFTHAEGDVMEHTCLALDIFAAMCEQELMDHVTEAEMVSLGWAVLLHDCGKPLEKRYGCEHAEAGSQRARELLERLACNASLIDCVSILVACHMEFRELSDGFADREYLASAMYGCNSLLLAALSVCDTNGRIHANDIAGSFSIASEVASGISNDQNIRG